MDPTFHGFSASDRERQTLQILVSVERERENPSFFDAKPGSNVARADGADHESSQLLLNNTPREL